MSADTTTPRDAVLPAESERVERYARELCRANGADPDIIMHEAQQQPEWQFYVDDARAAIALADAEITAALRDSAPQPPVPTAVGEGGVRAGLEEALRIAEAEPAYPLAKPGEMQKRIEGYRDRGYSYGQIGIALVQSASADTSKHITDKLRSRLAKSSTGTDGERTPAPASDLRVAAIGAAASLAAAISLLKRGSKKAAASDKMFDTMLDDYRKSLEALRSALTSTPAAPSEVTP